MEVSKKLWSRTSIGPILDVFTGKVMQRLSEASEEAIRHFPRHLDQLFRRWYFLRLSESENVTPFSKLEYFQHIEGWPKEGQFLIKPSLVKQEKALRIDLDVEFIDFWEQPLLKALSKDSSYFTHDKLYSELLESIKNTLKKLKIDPNNYHESSELVWDVMISFLSQKWRMEDPFIRQAFSMEGLIDINQTFLKQAYESPETGVGSDELILAYVSAVRKIFPDWAYTVSELEAEEEKGRLGSPKNFIERMKIETFLSLGINIDRFFLTPLTIYLNLLEPFYHDISCWELDFGEILKRPGGDSEMMLSDPPTSFRLTGFGKTLVRECLKL